MNEKRNLIYAEARLFLLHNAREEEAQRIAGMLSFWGGN